MKQWIAAVVIALIGSYATDIFAADSAGVSPASTSQTGYNWTGFYAGGHAGGAWGSHSRETFNAVNGAFVSSGGADSSGGAWGIQFGYDYTLPWNTVAGIEFRGSYENVESREINTNSTGTNVSKSEGRTSWSEAPTARLGYALDNWLFYALTGPHWTQGNSKRTQQIGTTGLATAGTIEKISTEHFGWSGGAGIGVGFATHWSASIEYRYTGFSDSTNVFHLAQRSSEIKDAHSNGMSIGLTYNFN
jgi:outer membrane immunogenic protein